MPQAIALAAFQAGLPLGVVNSIAGVGVAGAVTQALFGVAISVGASYAAARLFVPQVSTDTSRGEIEFQQRIPVRFWPYGRVKLSGPLALLVPGFLGADDGSHFDSNVTGTQLAKITLLSSREINGIHKFYLNDDLVTLDGSLYFVGANADGEDHISAKVYLGTSSQAADANLVANAGTALGWTSNHRLRSIAYSLTCQGVKSVETFTPVYGGHGHKEARAVVEGVKVYDPRKDSTNGGSGSHRTNNPATWEFSDNVTLCALDFLAHADGRNKGFSRIDWASFVAAANIDDEAVPLKAGGTEKRYRLATVYRFDEAKKDVMARILQARDGRIVKNADGNFVMRGGEWNDPDVTLDADDGSALIEADFAPGVPVMQRVNQFAPLKCMLPTHNWGEVELEPYTATNDPDFIAGRVFRQPLDLTQVPSHAQAQRLAKIYMARLNPSWIGEIKTNAKGLDAFGEDVVELNWSELDDPPANFDGPFWINGALQVDAAGGCAIPVASADPDSYDWDEDTEEEDPPPVPTYGDSDDGDFDD